MNETLSHFISAKVLAYIEDDYFNQIHDLIRRAEITLNGFMKYVRKQRAGIGEYGDNYVRDENTPYTLPEFEELEIED